VLGFVAPALVLGVWCLITYGKLVEPDFLPTPTEVLRGTLQLFIQYDLGTANPGIQPTHRAGVSAGIGSGAAAGRVDGGLRSGQTGSLNRSWPLCGICRFRLLSHY